MNVERWNKKEVSSQQKAGTIRVYIRQAGWTIGEKTYPEKEKNKKNKKGGSCKPPLLKVKNVNRLISNRTYPLKLTHETKIGW